MHTHAEYKHVVHNLMMVSTLGLGVVVAVVIAASIFA